MDESVPSFNPEVHRLMLAVERLTQAVDEMYQQTVPWDRRDPAILRLLMDVRQFLDGTHPDLQ